MHTKFNRLIELSHKNIISIFYLYLFVNAFSCNFCTNDANGTFNIIFAIDGTFGIIQLKSKINN